MDLLGNNVKRPFGISRKYPTPTKNCVRWYMNEKYQGGTKLTTSKSFQHIFPLTNKSRKIEIKSDRETIKERHNRLNKQLKIMETSKYEDYLKNTIAMKEKLAFFKSKVRLKLESKVITKILESKRRNSGNIQWNH